MSATAFPSVVISPISGVLIDKIGTQYSRASSVFAHLNRWLFVFSWRRHQQNEPVLQFHQLHRHLTLRLF